MDSPAKFFYTTMSVGPAITAFTVTPEPATTFANPIGFSSLDFPVLEV